MRVSFVQWIREFDSNDLLESGNARITLISESGLYRILAKCNLPKCEPRFVAKDACDCLAIADVSQACKNLDDDEKQVVARSPELSLLFRESSNAPTMTLISESGLYTLVMRSNKPEAKVFRKWEYQRISRLQDFANVKSLWDDGEIGLPQILGRRINTEDSWRNFAFFNYSQIASRLSSDFSDSCS